jgi:hypothetical protein
MTKKAGLKTLTPPRENALFVCMHFLGEQGFTPVTKAIPTGNSPLYGLLQDY